MVVQHLTDHTHDHLDELALVSESRAIDVMAFQGFRQSLFGIFPGIGPLLILVTSEGGALSCLLGLLHG